MSTTFAIDSGSAVQAEGSAVEEDSRLHTYSRVATQLRRRPRGPQPMRKNPNTPFPGRRRGVATVPAEDSQMAVRCWEALRWITTLPEGAVQVRVEGGRVILEGRVSHANEREVAADAVRQLDGVVDVENRIEVG